MKKAAWLFLKGVSMSWFDGRGRALLSAAVLAVGMQAGWAQDDDSASVPFIVNVDAAVSATDGATSIQIPVKANQEAILRIPLKKPDGIRFFGTQRQANAPSIVSIRNGKVTINLPARSYRSAEIALYAVNGKRILRAKTSALSAANTISRPNLANGVYLLSVRGADGDAVTSRLTHDGGGLSINAVFGGENVSASKRLAKETAAGDWKITVGSAGYVDTTYTLHPVAGLNTRQNITLRTASDGNGPEAWDPVWSCPSNISAGGLNLTKDNLGFGTHSVVVKFNNGAAPEVTFYEAMGSTFEVKNGEHVVLNVSYYYMNNDDTLKIIVSGTAKNGSLKIYEGGKKALYLNGTNITNPDGPAVNIQSGKRTDVHLVGDCQRRNIIKGAGFETALGAEQGKGAIFSEGSLVFGGTGTLEVRSTQRHAIVSDGFIEVENGSIIIYESKNNGLRANERITIKGGKLQIKCEGDAIKNERWKVGSAGTLCPITVSGGDIKIRTTGIKGHGIVSDSNDIIINGDAATKVDISLTGNGSKGIRSHGSVKISGATTTIEAYGARESLTDDTSSAAGIKADGNVEITKGILTIKSVRANENGKGLNIDGDLKISGGTTKIASDGDGVKARGSVTVSGGYLEAKSANKQDIDCGGKVNKSGSGVIVAEKIKQGS
jgi:hypothetical protein